ncbi:MAG: type I glutamate--ammonia ligase [Gammaproteobacteria bacterium]
MSVQNILDLIKEEEIKYVDLRFVDILGKWHHISVPAKVIDKDFFEQGKMIDGSSIVGWKEINESDMVLIADPTLHYIDPFTEEATLILVCDVFEPDSKESYGRCPRGIAKRAESYLKSTGLADTCYVGPEPEFFIFDDVRYQCTMQGSSYAIDSDEGAWNMGKIYPEGNMGHRPGIKGGYFPVPPVDSAQDLRSAMSTILDSLGIEVEAHHHEVATANQNEISTRFNTLLQKADEVMMTKYVIRNVAHAWGKTATFMPKPLVGDNGNGMHCHQSLSLKGKNVFAGSSYAHLSDEALYYIGGIIHHARALNAFANSSTNSYRRLVPGFEAPVMLAYSSCNRSAAIRVPYTTCEKGRRIEVRFPDPMSNPYLLFTAMMMAGLDGIQNRIHPGPAIEHNLYELADADAAKIPVVCASLEEALAALDADRAFLTRGGVMTDDLIDGFIALKKAEIQRVAQVPHPMEFEMYYSL